MIERTFSLAVKYKQIDTLGILDTYYHAKKSKVRALIHKLDYVAGRRIRGYFTKIFIYAQMRKTREKNKVSIRGSVVRMALYFASFMWFNQFLIRCRI